MNFVAKNQILFFILIALQYMSFSLYSNNYYKIIYPPDTIKPEKIIYQYDTLTVMDTVIYYDTIYSDNSFTFSTDAYFSSFYTNVKTYTNNEQYNNYLELRQQSEKYITNYLFGFALNLRHNKASVSLGLSYSTIRKKVDYNFVNITLTDQSYYDYIDNSYWNTYVVDSFYQVGIDTTWIVVVDSVYVPVNDSSLVLDYDTSKTNNIYNDINKFKYIEIPFIIGLTIAETNNFSFDVKTGLITGLLIRTQGKTVLPENQKNIVDIASTPMIATNFYLYLSAKISYSINNNYRFFAEPYYKKALKSIFDKNYLIKEKQYFMGFRLGLEYFF